MPNSGISNAIFSRRNILKYAAAITGTFAFTGLGIVPVRAATFKGVSYGKNQLDIYQPANAAGAPILIYVHGGAWKAGSRRSVGSKASYYNGKGYVFVSVDYTLYPRANAEQQAVEVAQAVNWVSRNATTYGGDPSRIALMGHSAGCHLSAMATLSGACTPKLLICNDTGGYDVAFLAEINNGRVPRLYSALDTKSKWARWSPISYVRNRRQPPTLVIWSGGENRDRISKRFADAMEAAGNSVTRFAGEGYSHISINSSVGKPGSSVTKAIDRFLQRL
jgi:acetyl esterase/lipase